MKLPLRAVRRVTATLVLLLVLPAVSACAAASAWWSGFLADPSAQVANLSTTVLNWLGIATGVFNALLPLLAADKQPAAQAKFNYATATVRHALGILNDGMVAAAQAKNDTPDFGALVNAVLDGVKNVQAVIDDVKGVAGTAPPLAAIAQSAGYDDLKAIGVSLEKHRVIVTDAGIQ